MKIFVVIAWLALLTVLVACGGDGANVEESHSPVPGVVPTATAPDGPTVAPSLFPTATVAVPAWPPADEYLGLEYVLAEGIYSQIPTPLPTSTPPPLMPLEDPGPLSIRLVGPAEAVPQGSEAQLSLFLPGLAVSTDYTLVFRSSNGSVGVDRGCARSHTIRHSALPSRHKVDMPLYACRPPGGEITVELWRGDNPSLLRTPEPGEILSRSSWPVRVSAVEGAPVLLNPIPNLLVPLNEEVTIDLSSYIKDGRSFRHRTWSPAILSTEYAVNEPVFRARGSTKPLLTLGGVKPGETLAEVWAFNRLGESARSVFFVLVADTDLRPPADLDLARSGDGLELSYGIPAGHNHLFTLYKQEGDSFEAIKDVWGGRSPVVFGDLEPGLYGASARSCHDVRRVYCEEAEFSGLVRLPGLPDALRDSRE